MEEKELVLKVENVSKQYRLGLVGTGTLKDDLKRWWYKIRGKEDPFLKVGAENDRSKKTEDKYVWALKDIDFEVKKGEVLGIIGKNGAGKSTLLKLLAKVADPTTGSIKYKGRIAALLEVGTGFHPELTGRENIFLNGAVLGMSKEEIASKVDEIIEFSGVAQYIDTPVKRYSSGMKVRLGFAVAAHLEPDILIVDEVLAVGDAEFQAKCIGKMQDVAGEGRTVLFVSHNMVSVKNLCNSGIVLENGKIVYSDTANNAVAFYQNSARQKSEFSISNRSDIQGDRRIEVSKIYFYDESGNEVLDLISGKDCQMIIDYSIKNKFDTSNLFVGITVLDSNEIVQTTIANDEMGFNFPQLESEGKITINFNKLNFRSGQYNYNIFISNKRNNASGHEKIFCLSNVGSFNVLQGDYWEVGNVNRPVGFIVDARISIS
jgi:lipopolysaccharide transport system ATP-binding protein